MAGVTIVDHDERWADLAQGLIAELRGGLEPHLRTVEHLGSTAVPGLPAKPVIDLMAPLPTLPPDPGTERALEELGYTATPVGMRDRSFYVRALPSGASASSVHLHLVLSSQWDTKNERLFRDHLLHHPEVAAAYGRLKRRLARQVSDVEEYTRAKTVVVQQAVDAERAARELPLVPVWEE